MHQRSLLFTILLVLAASFLASFTQEASLTGEAIRGTRISSFIPNRQPVSFVTSPTQNKVSSSFQTLLTKQFPTLPKTPLTSLQTISGASTLHTTLIAPWEHQLCQESGVIKKGLYAMTSDGLTRCIQQALTSCQKTSKITATTTVKTCLTDAEQLCKRGNKSATDRVPATFSVFEQLSDISTTPCFLSSVTTEGNGQYCFFLFTDQGTPNGPLRCQPSTKTGPLELSCSSKYIVSAEHSCKTDSIIKANMRRVTY